MENCYKAVVTLEFCPGLDICSVILNEELIHFVKSMNYLSFLHDCSNSLII